MKVGFTGTAKGMSITQMTQFESELIRIMSKFGGKLYRTPEFHHGGCVGADTSASRIAHRLGFYVVCHPPVNTTKIGKYYADETKRPNAYLGRNRAIVNAVNRMLATPFEGREKLRSGTWATIRYTRRVKKPLTIIY